MIEQCLTSLETDSALECDERFETATVTTMHVVPKKQLFQECLKNRHW